MQELIESLVKNQLVLSMLLNMGLVTFLIRNVSWFSRLGDAGRHLTALLSSVAVVSVLRVVGIEPTGDLVAQIPMLVQALVEALVTYLGGVTAFKIAKTQPPSE